MKNNKGIEIKKTIRLDVIKKGNNIICKDLTTLQLVVGTKGVSGNLHYYGITKNKNNYIVPISIIQKRILWLKERIKRFNDYLEIMEQIV